MREFATTEKQVLMRLTDQFQTAAELHADEALLIRLVERDVIRGGRGALDDDARFALKRGRQW